MPSRAKYPLIKNIHEGAPPPSNATDILLVRGDYTYHHYLCDGFNDVGWGCGFRVLQTLCSWIDSSSAPPSIEEMIKILDASDQPGETSWNPTKSKTPWIGTYEGFLICDREYDVSCRIIHIRKLADFEEHYDVIAKHFFTSGAPFFLGGNKDCFGKCVLGMCKTDVVCHFLILDPHFTGSLKNSEDAFRRECLKWIRVDELMEESFYNLLLPLFHKKTKEEF